MLLLLVISLSLLKLVKKEAICWEMTLKEKVTYKMVLARLCFSLKIVIIYLCEVRKECVAVRTNH